MRSPTRDRKKLLNSLSENTESKEKEKIGRIDRTKDIEPIKRRYDAIARLIAGSNPCAAVCFDGETILVSNNAGNFTDLMNHYFELFNEVARASMTIEEIGSNTGINSKIIELARISAMEDAKLAKETEDGSRKKVKEKFTQNFNAKREHKNATSKESKISSALSKWNEVEPTIDELIEKLPYASSKNAPKLRSRINKILSNIIENLKEVGINVPDAETSAPQRVEYIKKHLEEYKLKQKEALTLKEEAEQNLEDTETALSGSVSSYIKDLKKVLSSLAINSKKPFPKEVKEAFINKRIRSLSFKTNSRRFPKPVHAEMSIIQELFNQGKLNAGGRIYLGISRLCCANCWEIVSQIKTLYARAIETEAEERIIEIETRGAHNNIYPKWPIPPFVDALGLIYTISEDREGRNKEKADSSDSEAEF